MRRLRIHCFLVAMAGSIACANGIAPATAGPDNCHSKVIRAHGSPSVLESTAKSRARSAWIKKVRAKAKLGKNYAAWLRAKKPGYACRKVSRRIVCTASAIPCKV